MLKEFDAARRVDKGETLQFKLNGQIFTCLADLPGGMLLDWSKTATDPKLTDLERAEKVMEFFSEVLDEDSAERFNVGLHSRTDPITADQTTTVLNWLVEEYQGVPLDAASPSVPGPSSTGRTSTAPVSKAKSTRSASVRTAS